ncbi:hypothetical protein GCK32_014421 [Trichostrongylus colubriformis]|uniref:NTR domain-containing protein n=1 Tax=Trichostrongylus colubriformis TaxID=6319 RepID=A0AAN8FDQ7_TRICO
MRRLPVFLACVVTAYGQACTCTPAPSLKDAFCSSEFVSHVSVTAATEKSSTPPDTQEIVYDVQHIRVYKKPAGTAELPNQVFITFQSASCGVALAVGTEYLLGGEVADSGELRGNSCGLHMEWTSLSDADRAALDTLSC